MTDKPDPLLSAFFAALPAPLQAAILDAAMIGLDGHPEDAPQAAARDAAFQRLAALAYLRRWMEA